MLAISKRGNRQKSGLCARTIYWERRARISSIHSREAGYIYATENRHSRCRDTLPGRGGPYILSQEILQSCIVQHGVSKSRFRRVFSPPGSSGALPRRRAPELRFPFVDRGIADRMLAASISVRPTPLARAETSPLILPPALSGPRKEVERTGALSKVALAFDYRTRSGTRAWARALAPRDCSALNSHGIRFAKSRSRRRLVRGNSLPAQRSPFMRAQAAYFLSR
ncbi:hypothetical protein IQ26_06856 [Mesorhizobium tianshanense]|uniref:Uncharacterized protein n=1 Tax=Mesorhizobium tianshanense TaxID=39844 RepID=A0A562MNI6_9HYPH|nr:hypothetical protein IQ26_06856 [Mesorhizobium tianshanense]